MNKASNVCRAAKLEEEVRKAREAESQALQNAASALGKAEVLQNALQKAEERAATLEFQVSCRLGWIACYGTFEMGNMNNTNNQAPFETTLESSSFRILDICCRVTAIPHQEAQDI